MYTSIGYGVPQYTILTYYHEWKGKNQENSECIRCIDDLKRGAYREVLRYDPGASAEMDEDELIRRADQLACFSRKGFRGNSGYDVGPTFNLVLCANTLYSTILAHCFHGEAVGLCIPPEYVPMFDWRKLECLLGTTTLRRIGVMLPFGLFPREEEKWGTFWDVVKDRCYKFEVTFGVWTEIEDGFPLEVDYSSTQLLELPANDAFLELRGKWLSMPVLTEAEASAGFYEGRARFSMNC